MQHPEAKRDEFRALIRDLEGKSPRIPQVKIPARVVGDFFICVHVCVGTFGAKGKQRFDRRSIQQ